MCTGITLIAIFFLSGVITKKLDEDMFLYWRRSDSTKCIPFTTYHIACNKCVCSADGTSYCTKMACKQKPPPQLLLMESQEQDVFPVNKDDGDSSKLDQKL